MISALQPLVQPVSVIGNETHPTLVKMYVSVPSVGQVVQRCHSDVMSVTCLADAQIGIDTGKQRAEPPFAGCCIELGNALHE